MALTRLMAQFFVLATLFSVWMLLISTRLEVDFPNNTSLIPPPMIRQREITASPRVAMCIRGEYRDLGNLETIKRFIVDPMNADVFLAMQGATADKTNRLKPVAFDYKDYSYDQIMTIMQQEGLNTTFWKEKVAFSWNALAPFMTFHARGGSAIFQYFSMKQCDDLITEYETEHNMRYDWVAMVRSDDYCLGVPFCFGDEDVYIPKDDQDYFGVSDRMILIRRKYSSQVLKGPWNDLTQNNNWIHYSHNTEFVLKLRIKDALGIKYDYNYNNVRSGEFTENFKGLGRPRNTCFIACNPSTHSSWGSCNEVEFEKNDEYRRYKGYKYKLEYQSAHKNTNASDYSASSCA